MFVSAEAAGSAAPPDPIRYADLQRWFFELFDPDDAVFFGDRGSAVLGIDAMFWRE